MNHSYQSSNHQPRGGERRGARVRRLCAVLALAFCLTAFVGCTREDAAEALKELKSELSDALQEIDALRFSNEAAQQQIDSLKDGKDAATQEIESLKDANEAAKQEIESLTSANEAAKSEIASLKDANAAANQEIETLKGNNESAKEEIETLKNANEAARQEIEALKAQIKDLENQIPPEDPNRKIRIYIDQGHNPTSYHNAGATGNGLYEQDLTYAIGHLLAQLLEADGRFEVRLSRPTATTVLGTDQSTSLEARVQGAKDFRADYLISLHTNAFDTASANGIEVLVAETEGVSYDFGSALLRGLIHATGLNNRGMKQRTDLYILNHAPMPTALLEMGFITNAADAALLSKSPDRFANGIYEGILTYFSLPSVSAP